MTDRLKKLMAFHEADPDDDVAAYAIAREHLKADNREDARRWIETMLQINPDYAFAHFQRARMLLDFGDVDQAHQAIEDGLGAAQRSRNERAAEELRELMQMLQSYG